MADIANYWIRHRGQWPSSFVNLESWRVAWPVLLRPANIVEGCAREGERDFLRFLEIALASCRELLYLASLSQRLGLMDAESTAQIEAIGGRTAAAISRLRESLKRR